MIIWPWFRTKTSRRRRMWSLSWSSPLHDRTDSTVTSTPRRKEFKSRERKAKADWSRSLWAFSLVAVWLSSFWLIWPNSLHKSLIIRCVLSSLSFMDSPPGQGFDQKLHIWSIWPIFLNGSHLSLFLFLPLLRPLYFG